ncbi:MAG: HD domain-containing protein [Kofleriaceae bacterium]|nr:HD domain-containing protein [Kofleriaceae bacterium]
MTPADAIAVLQRLGAVPWLVRHHELVLEAAVSVCDRFARELAFDRDAVLLGAALHDAGKIIHPAEMSAPGHEHEAAGRELLLRHGVSPSIARFCVTHAAWNTDDATVEDLLVALADKLWKGKRDEALEQRIVEVIAAATKRQPWAVFDRVDAICEAVAAHGPDRLVRSAV